MKIADTTRAARAAATLNEIRAEKRTVEEAHLEMLRRRCAALEAQVEELTALVREIPGKLIAARLDEREGKETKYDYDRAARAMAIRVV